MTSGDWGSTIGIENYISITFLAHWMTGQLDDWSGDFGFLSKQPDAPPIGMLVYLSDTIHFILDQFIASLVQILYLCFDFESLIGHQIMSHLECFCDWV